jgi:predicted nucleic acid-binding protein
MPYFTYDTSVIISRKLPDLREMPQDFVMSSVVLLELTASAADASMRKLYEQVFNQYRRDKLLIVPNDDDWLLASKVLFLLTNARRYQRTGKLTRLPPGASQHIALDVLIAVSARRWKAQVVTENWSDFKAIRRYCNATVIRASKFFREEG